MGNKSYSSAMLSAIDKQRYERVVEIIEKYPDVLNKDLSSEIMVTPLARAAWRCDLQLVDILLKNGANVNEGGSSSITPLMWAARRDHAYLVSILIDYHANVLLKSNEGFSALDYAIVHGNYRPALFLFEFDQETKDILDYYQFAKDRDYRYVNYEMFLSHLKQKTDYQNLPNIFAKPQKRKLLDPVVDPRESWGSIIKRTIDFEEPPMVERSELPPNLQPQNRFWGKIRQQINGLAVEPSQRSLQVEEGQCLNIEEAQKAMQKKSQSENIQGNDQIHDQMSLG